MIFKNSNNKNYSSNLFYISTILVAFLVFIFPATSRTTIYSTVVFDKNNNSVVQQFYPFRREKFICKISDIKSISEHDQRDDSILFWHSAYYKCLKINDIKIYPYVGFDNDKNIEIDEIKQFLYNEKFSQQTKYKVILFNTANFLFPIITFFVISFHWLKEFLYKRKRY